MRASSISLALATLMALTACGKESAVVPPPRLPDQILPELIDGLEVQREAEGVAAFRKAGPQALIADGVLFTLRKEGTVQGSLQVAVFKSQYDSEDDEVRRGVRKSVEHGIYRYFKVGRQWVGEQRLPEIGIYLWFPPRSDVYEVLVTRPELGIPKSLLNAIIDYQSRELADERGSGSSI